MQHPLSRILTIVSIIAWVVLVPVLAHAYIGPGVGIGAIAVTITLFFGFLLLLVGLVWFPLKRLLKSKKAKSAKVDEADGAQ